MSTECSITDWLDELLPMVPGASLEGGKQALRATFREFTVESGAWMRETNPVSIRAGRDTYYLEPTACGDNVVLYIQAITYMTDDGTNFVRKLTPLEVPEYRGRTITPPAPTPWGYTTDADEPGKFTLIPGVSTDINNALIPYVSLGFKEKFEDDKIPLRFRRYWFDHILEGAAGRLQSQQDKPYTNLVLSQYYKKRFRRAIALARDMGRKQMGRVESDFTFPFWA